MSLPPINHGLKPKDLIGIPWRVAFALQADGWWLRQDIIWAKPNPMPESVTDRCTKAHEYIFLLTKSARYYMDMEAVKEPSVTGDTRKPYGSDGAWEMDGRNKWDEGKGKQRDNADGSTRNRRDVWTITTKPFKEAHFATFPPEIPEICIKAGTSEKGQCPECGAPWVRMVEKSGGTTGKSWHDHSDDMGRGMSTSPRSITDQQEGRPYTVRTTGWRPTCNCGIFTCNQCSTVVEYCNNTVEVKNGKVSDTPEVWDGTQVLGMQDNLQEHRQEYEVLQPQVCSKMDDQKEERSRENCNIEGIRPSIEEGPPNGIERRVCNGTPYCDGGTFEEDIRARRSDPPHQRDKERQQVGELNSFQENGTRPKNEQGPNLGVKMSKLWARVFEKGQCPQCGGELTHDPPKPVPCVVLDIFSGAGTVGYVCERLDRKYIGIELNPDYIDMSECRIDKEVLPMKDLWG